MPIRYLSILLLLLGACRGSESSQASQSAPHKESVEPPPGYGLERVLGGPKLTNPVHITHAKDGGELFVIEQRGRILAFAGPTSASQRVFLDLNAKGAKVRCCGEEGLLSLALHPQVSKNGQFFVYYTASSDPRRSIISRFQMTPDKKSGNLESERILLEIAQPYPNHNGGLMLFGPDGMLYIGLGDGGSANDPQNRAQNRNELLGKMLRIDVDHAPAGKTYGIPPDNPFVGQTGMRPEIWAWGLRNPWRFAFDGRPPHKLWAADVGQDLWEEIDIIERGKNYGWKIMEGGHCRGSKTDTSCRSAAFEMPIATYDHGQGCSVTGGVVYRGSRMPSLQGAFVYGDFCTGHIWAVREGESPKSLIVKSGLHISTFGETQEGEILVADYGGAGIHQIVPGTADAPKSK